MPHGEAFPVDEHGRKPWEVEGITYRGWRKRQVNGSLPDAEFRALVRKVREAARGELGGSQSRKERRGWHDALLVTFGGKHSNISKSKALYEEQLGYLIPSSFEVGSHAEKDFLLDWLYHCAPEGQRPTVDDPKLGLSSSGQAKLEKFKLAFAKQLEATFVNRVQQAALDKLDVRILPELQARERECFRIENAKRGVFTKAEFQVLLKCVHPDNSATADVRNEGFRLLRAVQGLLVKPDAVVRNFPHSLIEAEILKRRRAAEAKRDA